ncbi:Sulfotransferase 1C2 [Halotydeus destructor]|nr:Sulfotransferase 1C2 [Halotydeus destructor]
MTRLPFSDIGGFKFPIDVPEDQARQGLNYVAHPEDVFLCSYPKCGSTWMVQIVLKLLASSNNEDSQKLDSNTLQFLEQGVIPATGPVVVKSHFPFNVQPSNPHNKYIVVLRNAKDACVSYYFHKKLIPQYSETFKTYTMQDHIQAFLDGDLTRGSYFDWVLSWWAQKDNLNIKFFLYEDMKTKPKEAIVDVAKFLGLEDVAEDETLVNSVLEYTSFSALKGPINAWMKQSAEARTKKAYDGEFTFLRKGEIGDYKNHFTAEENEAYNKFIAEKFGGTGLEHLWDSYDVVEM